MKMSINTFVIGVYTITTLCKSCVPLACTGGRLPRGGVCPGVCPGEGSAQGRGLCSGEGDCLERGSAQGGVCLRGGVFGQGGVHPPCGQNGRRL